MLIFKLLREIAYWRSLRAALLAHGCVRPAHFLSFNRL